MENTLSRDGGAPNTMNANIDMNSVGRITNLTDAVNNQEPITLAQAAFIAGVINPLTQTTVGAVLWPQHAVETSNSVTAVNLHFYYGDVMRYDAKIDGSTDDTGAFNAALQSGWAAFCDMAGNSAIEGTIVLDGNSGTGTAKSLTLNPSIRLQRYTDVDIPMVHVWGLFNYFDGRMGQLAHKTYAYTNGMLLLGQDPTGAYTDDDHAVSTQSNVITNLRMIGHQTTIEGNGNPAFYIHSAGRKRGNFLGINCYYNSVQNVTIIQADICFEFSTDANANSLVGCVQLSWNTAAFWFNGSYGNQIVANKMEKGVIVVGSARRYAIHLDNLNSGTEIDTDLDYPIGAAQDNYIQTFVEIHNNANQVVSLMTFSAGNSTAANTSGSNEINAHGTMVAGLGINGFSTEASIGPNWLSGDVAFADYTRIWKKGEREWRNLDDGSGQIEFLGGVADIGGRKANQAESATIPIFSMDNIGPGVASVMVKLTYCGKADAAEENQAGEMWWVGALSNDTTYEFVKLFDVSTAFGGTALLSPILAVAIGTLANSMKISVNIDTLNPPGSNSLFYSWTAQLIASNLEGTNLDWAADVKLL